uniref:Uncharacterized protein n=1 Tax=Vespula pensylvanica TaxID=30213 RepID=A0A834UGZ0_VESPE|nr:hypothetical protein H0235_001371 [Vespula pensylvanica]
MDIEESLSSLRRRSFAPWGCKKVGIIVDHVRKRGSLENGRSESGYVSSRLEISTADTWIMSADNRVIVSFVLMVIPFAEWFNPLYVDNYYSIQYLPSKAVFFSWRRWSSDGGGASSSGGDSDSGGGDGFVAQSAGS